MRTINSSSAADQFDDCTGERKIERTKRTADVSTNQEGKKQECLWSEIDLEYSAAINTAISLARKNGEVYTPEYELNEQIKANLPTKISTEEASNGTGEVITMMMARM